DRRQGGRRGREAERRRRHGRPLSDLAAALLLHAGRARGRREGLHRVRPLARRPEGRREARLRPAEAGRVTRARRVFEGAGEGVIVASGFVAVVAVVLISGFIFAQAARVFSAPEYEDEVRV